MRIRYLTFIVLLFVFGAMAVSSLAQAKSCNLQLKFYEFKETGDSEQFPINDVKVTLVEVNTGKSLKIVKSSNFSAVNNLVEGNYNLLAAKEGFQKTSDIVSLDCSLADTTNTVSEIVFLWNGNSKETVSLSSSGAIGARGRVESGQNYSASETVNGSAVSLGKPTYPNAARMVRASGTVQVQVLINQLGYVVSAKAVSGHPLLQASAVEAAKISKFKMTLLEGKPVKVSGIITYNFVP